MASLFHIIDEKGLPLITRCFRGDVTHDATKIFTSRVIEEEEFAITPVFEHDGFTYCFIRVNDVYFLTVSRLNTIPLMLITFMQRVNKVFTTYFKRVNEESIRDNFVIIYELLDEMMDFGYPQFTEEKILKEYITQQPLLQIFETDTVKSLPTAVTGADGAVPWRKPNIKHSKNEAFLDVVESVSVLINQTGETLSSEIIGELKMNTKLSGMPVLKLGLSDRVVFNQEKKGHKALGGKTVELEDVKFHQCVKLNQFEADRSIIFIPPDGEFNLMTYRLSIRLKPLILVSCNIIRHGTSRVEMEIRAQSAFKKTSTATSAEIHIPIPIDANKPSAKATTGSIKYVPESGTLLWSLKQLRGGKDFSCRCEYTLPSVRVSDPAAFSKRPISVVFEIPFFTASGFQVKYLNVEEKSKYRVSPWVRYVTKSGEYQIRSN
eukprot:Tbor_TRINITY_DN6155_c3_g1::TRINITY_DN6155_c3_g1_i1::g.22662::m.22662/K12393/AP1M; AP-1 complex subunit mu